MGDTGQVTVGTQPLHSDRGLPAPSIEVADLDRVRSAVGSALADFLAEQRITLATMDPALAPVVDEVCALARGGKRLRPLFAYWGWRGLAADAPDPAEDDEAVLRAVAAL